MFTESDLNKATKKVHNGEMSKREARHTRSEEQLWIKNLENTKKEQKAKAYANEVQRKYSCIQFGRVWANVLWLTVADLSLE